MRKLAICLGLLAVGCGMVTTPARPAKAKKKEPVATAQSSATPAPTSPVSRPTDHDWPGFLGPFGTSVSPEKGIIAPWPKQGLKLVWHRAVGEGYCMPSIARGKLYHFDRVGQRARLRCLTADTGMELWQFDYPTNYRDYYGYDGGPRCGPVLDDGRVYLHGPEGMLHCLDADTGELHWKVDTKAEFGFVQNFFGVGSTPVVEGDLLIVQIGGSPPNSDEVPLDELKGNGSGVVAFDKRTGKVRWQASDELASYATPVLATIAGRRWCFVFARGGLIGLEPASGKVDFHFPWRAKILESVNAANPVVAGDRVFISECYGPGSAALRVKPGGCELLWSDADRGRDKAMQCHWATPIHIDGYLYGCSGRHTSNADIRCVELATGRVMWKEPASSRTSFLLADGYLICLGEYGELFLVRPNPQRYEEISRIKVRDAAGQELLKEPCWAAPILCNGLLYVRGEGRIVCLELIPPK